MRLMDKIFPRRFVARSLSSHLGTPWAMSAGPMRMVVDEARARLAATSAAELRELAMRGEDERPPLGGLREDGCYWIPVSGTIIRGDASCAREMGMDATGLEEIERALAMAAEDPRCTSVELEVDSPGGTAVGVQEVADLIGALGKPVRAEIAGQCASAAYWLISQCAEIVAERSSLVGSIGVFSVLEDTSKAAIDAGVTVHVVRSGPQKGAGVDGSPVASEHLAAAQVIVDDLAALFAASVAQGRGLSIEAARALATGDSWIASKALDLGLIDAFTAPETDAASEPPSPAPAEIEPDEDEINHHAPMAGAQQSEPFPGSAEVNMELEKELAAAREQLAKATQELEAEKAKSSNTASVLADIRRQQRLDVIERHAKAGRVTPAQRQATEDMAAKAFAEDAAGLDVYLSTLPIQTRPTPAGGTPDAKATAVETGDDLDAASIERVARRMGLKPEDVAANARNLGLSMDGTPVRRMEVIK